MGKDYAQKLFGNSPVDNAVLADSTGGDALAGAKAALSGIAGFDSIVDDKSYQCENFIEFSSVSSAVVLIYLVLAVLMAVVVLLNLNVMFIEEKKRDLIVLMINGFSVKDAKRYIYTDTIVLTVFGIIAGVIVGCIMDSITVMAIEPQTASFVKGIDWSAVLIGILGSGVLTTIMCIIALRRIPRFKLTDINRM